MGPTYENADRNTSAGHLLARGTDRRALLTAAAASAALLAPAVTPQPASATERADAQGESDP